MGNHVLENCSLVLPHTSIYTRNQLVMHQPQLCHTTWQINKQNRVRANSASSGVNVRI